MPGQDWRGHLFNCICVSTVKIYHVIILGLKVIIRHGKDSDIAILHLKGFVTGCVPLLKAHEIKKLIFLVCIETSKICFLCFPKKMVENFNFLGYSF